MLKHKINENVFNPTVMKGLENVREAYLDNIEHIDLIIQKENPSKQEIVFVLGLLETDESYAHYFYRRVTTLVWFPILKKKGVFDASNNPAPVAVDNGFHVPLWEPIMYAERLVKYLPEDKTLTAELVTLIEDISKNPKDNFRTWVSLLKIVRALPNEKVSLQILDYIPLWLSGRFRTTLESMEICEHILPKFLIDPPSVEDIEKARKVLFYLFEIYNPEKGANKEKYRARAEIQYLSEVVNFPANLTYITKHLGDETIVFLGEQIKRLIYDYPNGFKASFSSNDIAYKVLYGFQNNKLSVKLWQESSEDDTIEVLINDFEKLSDEELQQNILAIIRKKAPLYLPEDRYEDPLKTIIFVLNHDSTAGSGGYTIQQLDGIFHGDHTKEAFTSIFRNLLNEIASQDPARAVKLFQNFCSGDNRRVLFFKRVVLYVISQHWSTSKEFFWHLFEENSTHFFTIYAYRKDFYNFLQAIQHQLTAYEKVVLDKLIAGLGKIDNEPGEEEDYPYQRLNWYAALRDIEPFQEKYEELAKQTGYDHKHFENMGNVSIRSGSVSPLSVQDILNMPSKELMAYILTFKPEKHWDDVSVDGLASNLAKAIGLNPVHFAKSLTVYREVYLIYAYHIFMGFQQAWKAENIFDWERVIDYALDYINAPGFQEGDLKLDNDSWNADNGWVAGALANMLNEGLRDDKHAIPIILLPKVKRVLITLAQQLQPIDDFKEGNLNYPNYLVNSTTGKILRTLFDYSLYRARTLPKRKQKDRWENDVREIFDSVHQRGFLESYTIQGMYYPQFHYLDKEWVTKHIKNNLVADEKLWLAFMGGIAFAHAPYSNTFYQLLYPHYKQAINRKTPLSDKYNSGLNNHIMAFYFYEFEQLNKDGLLYKVIDESDTSEVLSLVRLFWGQKAYLDSLKDEEKPTFRQRIKSLWQLLTEKYKNPKDEQEKDIVASLVHLLHYFDILGQDETYLVLKSIPFFKPHSHTNDLVEQLERLKANGVAGEVAAFLAEILLAMDFLEYLAGMEQKPILDLVDFLYENGQKEKTNQFCNKISQQGHDFLKDIYKKNNQ